MPLPITDRGSREAVKTLMEGTGCSGMGLFSGSDEDYVQQLTCRSSEEAVWRKDSQRGRATSPCEGTYVEGIAINLLPAFTNVRSR